MAFLFKSKLSNSILNQLKINYNSKTD